jgi:hypothetical protein
VGCLRRVFCGALCAFQGAWGSPSHITGVLLCSPRGGLLRGFAREVGKMGGVCRFVTRPLSHARADALAFRGVCMSVVHVLLQAMRIVGWGACCLSTGSCAACRPSPDRKRPRTWWRFGATPDVALRCRRGWLTALSAKVELRDFKPWPGEGPMTEARLALSELLEKAGDGGRVASQRGSPSPDRGHYVPLPS